MDLSLAKKAYSVYLRLFDAEESIDEYFLHYMKIFWEDLETLLSVNDISNPKIQANIYFFKLFYSYLLRIAKTIEKSTSFENFYTISIISYLILFEDKIRHKLSENHENFPHLTNHIRLIGNKYQQFSVPFFAAILDRQFHHENEYQKLKEEFFKLIGVNTQEKSNNNNNQLVEYMSDYFSILLVDVLNENENSSYPPSTPFDGILSKILSPATSFIDSIIDCDKKLSNFPLVTTHLIDLIYRLVPNNEKIGEIQRKWIEKYSITIIQSSMPYYITLPYILQLNPKLNPKSNNQIEIYLSEISLNSFCLQKILNLCFKFEKPFLASSFAHKFANQLEEKNKFAESVFWYAKEIQILVDYKIAAVKQIRDFSDMLVKQIESDRFIDGASEILADLNYIIEVLSSFQLFDEVDLEFLRQYSQYLSGDKMKLYEIMEKMTAPKKFWIPILSRICEQKDYTLTPNQIKITLARLEELFLVHTKIARKNEKEISRLRKFFSEVLSTSLLSN